MSLKSITAKKQFSKLIIPPMEGRFDSVFSKLKLNGLVSKVAKKTSQVQSKFAPGWSVNKVDNLLYAPKNGNEVASRAPKGVSEETISTRSGSVHAYITGSGPLVLFVHGWGGSASQFISLMRGLARCGFTAMAFDHLGHGLSEPKPTTMQQSIDTTNDILQHVRKSNIGGIAAIVGHSTGCIAIANARPALIKEIPLFLISPVFNYKLFFLKRLVKLKLHTEVVKQYAARFGKAYKLNFQKYELGCHLARYADISIIAHDESDCESAVGDSVKFCQQNPLTRLLVTKKFDHKRIVNSESVWQELKSTLNYDDSTINFSEVIFQD